MARDAGCHVLDCPSLDTKLPAMTLVNLVLNTVLGIILGRLPSVLTRSKACGFLAVDVGLGRLVG